MYISKTSSVTPIFIANCSPHDKMQHFAKFLETPSVKGFRATLVVLAAHIVAMVTCYIKPITATHCLPMVENLYDIIIVESLVKQWLHSSFKAKLLKKVLKTVAPRLLNVLLVVTSRRFGVIVTPFSRHTCIEQKWDDLISKVSTN